MEQDFEKDLHQLATANLNAKAPYVSDKNVGFNIIDQDEADQKGMGVFVLNLNGKYMYVPVFFINGMLKDMIMMYHKTREKFFPLTKEWTAYFESQGVPKMGDPISSSELPDVMNSPFNFYRMNNPAMLGLSKMGSSSKEGELVKDFMTKHASDKTKQVVATMLKSNKGLMQKFASLYTQEEIKTMISPRVHEAPIKEAGLKIIDNIDDAMDLGPADKMLFQKAGFVVKDKRKKLNNTYEFSDRPRCHTPMHDDIYHVYTDQGFKKCLVSLNPFIMGGAKRMESILVMDIESGNYKSDCEPLDLFVHDKDGGILGSISKLKTIPVKSMQVGKKYMIYNHKHGDAGKFSAPFSVASKAKNKNGKTYFTLSNYCHMLGDSYGRVSIETIDRDHISWNQPDCYVGENFMAMEVKDDVLCCCSKDVFEVLEQENHDHIKVAGLVEYKNGKIVESHQNIKEATLKIANRYNVCAIKAIDAVQTDGEFWIQKEAAPRRGTGGGPRMMSNADYTQDDIDNRSIEEVRHWTEEDAPQGVHSNYYQKKRVTTVDEDVNKLMALSRMDSLNKIFDEGFLGILANITDAGREIKQFIPELVNAMDRIGRTIGIIWYHAYTVKDSFAINEYSEFESLLKDIFVNLGDAILKIHGKDLTRRL